MAFTVHATSVNTESELQTNC